MPAIMELGSSCAAEFTVSLAPITKVKSVSVGQTFTYKVEDLVLIHRPNYYFQLILGSVNPTPS